MVSRTYLARKPASGPKGLHAVIDQEVVPAAANAAFGLELWVDDVAERVRESPLTALAAVAGATWLLTTLVPYRHSVAPRSSSRSTAMSRS